MKTKLTEQVISKTCMATTISSGRTSAEASIAIDRLGYNTAFFVAQAFGATGGTTITHNLYQTDVSTGAYTQVTSATVSGSISTTYTWTLVPSSVSTIAAEKCINLSGLKRFIKIYTTVTGAITASYAHSVAAILGDGVVEPAV
jgi:hypothetical protein